MSATAPAPVSESGSAATVGPAPRADSPRAVRRDLRFLRWYAYTVMHVMTRYQGRDTANTHALVPVDLLDRVERELTAESRRMRAMARAILGVMTMPLLLAGFLWSGLYWLPVRILWLPFERGMYRLPLFSLYEWFSFLVLAAFLAYSAAMLIEGFASTHRASAEFRRLRDATPDQRAAIAHEARTGRFPRAAFLLSHAKPFASYAPLLATPAENSGPPQ